MDSESDDHKWPGCPIRRSADQRVLAPPPGLSQRATSFIASQCQGIHQMPLLRAYRATPNGKHHLRRNQKASPVFVAGAAAFSLLGGTCKAPPLEDTIGIHGTKPLGQTA